jgi:hypothetical protein
MGTFQDYFELRGALNTMRHLARRLSSWQRDAATVAKEMEGLPRPTASENFQYPDSLQNLPTDVRDLRQYIESMTPKLAHDEEALREEVQPIYKAVMLLESIMLSVRHVSRALRSVEQLLTSLNEYGPYHEMMLAEANSLPVPVRQAVRLAAQVVRIKLNPVLETLRAFQQLCDSDPLLNRRKATRLLVELDPHWRDVLHGKLGTMEDDDDDWDDEDDDEDEEDYDRPLKPLKKKPPRFDDMEDDDEEEEDASTAEAMRLVHGTHLLKAPQRKSLDEDPDEDEIEYDDDGEGDDDDDDEDIDDVEMEEDEEDDIEYDEDLSSKESSTVYTASPDDVPPKQRFKKRIKRKKGKGGGRF